MRIALLGLAGLLAVAGCGSVAPTSTATSEPVSTSRPVAAGEPRSTGPADTTHRTPAESHQSAAPYAGPMQLRVDDADDPTVLERSGAAGRALECRGEPYRGGGGDYVDGGAESAQDTPSAALRDFLAERFLQVPGVGYRVERRDGARVLFSYDVDGQSKITLIAADGIRDFDGNVGWGIETWAQCDPAELPAALTEDLGLEVWQHASGHRAPVTAISSSAGPEHCGWEDITFLWLGLDDVRGTSEQQFLRDTTGELADFLATTFAASVALPPDATDTGYERGGRRLWLDPDGTAAYLVDTSDAQKGERWPASTGPVLCA